MDLAKTINCPNNHKFEIPWIEKRHPTLVFLDRQRGLVRQHQLILECPICQTKVDCPLPCADFVGELNVYGDEAKREVDNKTVLVYCFVSFSGSQGRLQEFLSRFHEIKFNISKSPWIFHANEIVSGDKRLGKEHLSHLTKSSAHDLMLAVSDLVREFNRRGDLNIYSSISIHHGIGLKKPVLTELKRHVYMASLLQVVGQSTKCGLAPRFYFERTGTDGWAKNLFDGNRLTLLWSLLTNCLPVMSPQFVRPEFNPLLEIADLCAFMIARHLYCIGKRAEGGKPEDDLDSSILGIIRYMLTLGDGGWKETHSVGFPNELLLRGTTWEPYI